MFDRYLQKLGHLSGRKRIWPLITFTTETLRKGNPISYARSSLLSSNTMDLPRQHTNIMPPLETTEHVGVWSYTN